MADYIRREAVNNIIEDMRNNHFILMSERVNLALLKSKIAEIPAADVQPVKYGRWLPAKGWFMSKCSECGYELGTVLAAGYICCPKCTARMDGEQNG